MAHADGDSVARIEYDAPLLDERAIGVVLAEVRRERQGNLRRIDEVANRVLDVDSRWLDRSDYWLVVLHRVDGE